MKRKALSFVLRVGIPAAVIYLLPFVYPNKFFIDVLQQVGYTWILVAGLNLLVGYSGQISLGQVGFFGLGAYGSALVAKHFHVPVPLAMLTGVALSAAFGFVVGLLALRVRGLYLAMVTIATGSLVEILANRWTSLTGGPMGIADVPRLTVGGAKLGPVEYYWLIAFTGLLVTLGLYNLVRSRFGRTWLAVKNSEIAARALGIDVLKWKVGAFVLNATLGGLAGAFFAHQNSLFTSDTFTYDVSVRSLVAVIIGGTGTMIGPVIGSALVIGLPTFFRQLYDYYLLLFGGILLLTLLLLPDGIGGAVARLWKSFRGKARTAQLDRPEGSQAPLPDFLRRTDGPPVRLEGLSMFFQGVKAVNNLTMTIAPGEVHGLIGPNGSGKSTTINVITGIYTATAGQVSLGDETVTSRAPDQLARLGMTRTFQNIQLFTDLTVLDNVLVGFHRHMSAGYIAHLLRLPSALREEAAFRERAMAILQFVGIDHLAGEEAKNLSYGQQRLVEIARALATEPRVLMLDEPAAGLNNVEVHRMTALIREIARGGITLLIVEHHMEMVMELCDAITVLNFGEKIAEGNALQVKSNPKVIEAYLGGDDVISLLNGEVARHVGD
ncbi:MAG TPA: branched-chain amino acid ABC transporter ATP-binding protein/permease [Symbiobacteriaceae bacterium]|jgi:branched-chain amino acid transport system permease protein